MQKLILFPILTLICGSLLTVNNSARSPGTAAYPEELPGAFTGGFGEETCHSCHFDYPLNPESGSLKIEGIPENYRSGKTYIIKIYLERDNLGRAGFQMSSRFEDGSQAGEFVIKSDSLRFTNTKENIQFIQHSGKVPEIAKNQSTVLWEITWEAPKKISQKIIFNVAANAGNGDTSAFGDFIYVRELEIEGIN